ncbi:MULTISPECIES: LPP20 family lipoprotein [unclassified Marinobacter]|uniref:LPP20 family lipoprotein n=1 Tax=unclassified Marinobacter TaxID=83889 RepID=UPI00190772F7|nr:LPP20 family lipoprotein [Marinobacter sp. 1-4A]MBK1850564.1 LPP20 family lipoprotein [Marinobacter sp. 1-4A]
MVIRWITISFLAFTLTACAALWGGDTDTNNENAQNNAQFEPITVRVSGFGTYEDAGKDRLNTRKRLMARRASQVDAYRNLAERVYGTVIFGSSTVNEFVLRNDMYRTYVDSYIRGAKMVAVNEHSDGVVETVMELKLESRFRACVSRVAAEQVKDLCPISVPTYNESVGDVQSKNVDSLYYLD